jgi:hypothetical protein
MCESAAYEIIVEPSTVAPAVTRKLVQALAEGLKTIANKLTKKATWIYAFIMKILEKFVYQ